jgi:hypothetical protein
MATHERHEARGLFLWRELVDLGCVAIIPAHLEVVHRLREPDRFAIDFCVLRRIGEVLGLVDEVAKVIRSEAVQDAAQGLIVGEGDQLHVGCEMTMARRFAFCLDLYPCFCGSFFVSARQQRASLPTDC